MSALPAQVRKQVDRANQLIEQINAPAAPAPAEGAPANEPAPAPAAAAPAPASASNEPAAAAPAAPAPAAPKPDFEQQYRVLQGKYNAEVPRLQAQVRELMGANRALQEQVTATNALLASLGGQAQRPASGAPTAQPQSMRLVKDEEIREYGADLIDVVRRAAQEAVLPEIDRRIDQRVQPVAQKIESVASQATSVAQRIVKQDQASVHRMLTEHVPNWQQLDEDAGFLNWLDQTDPFSGRTRGEMLQEAYRAFDGPRVVAFFKGYLNEHAAVTPPASGAPAAPQGASPQTRLEDMVVPGTPKAGAAGAQDGANNKRIWSRDDIAKFYRDKQQGLYRREPKKAAAIEADIFAAQREGRIR